MLKEKKCEKTSCQKKTSIGGQALIEGIMMRGPELSAMAVRNPEGEIVLEKWPTSKKKPKKIFTLPIIRGVYNFILSMTAGYKCLMRSAEIAGLDDLEEEAPKKEKVAISDSVESSASAIETAQVEATEGIEKTEEKIESEEKKEDKEGKEKSESSSALMTVIMIVSVVLGVGLALFLFMFLPSLIFEGIAYLLPVLKQQSAAVNSLIKSVFEGLLRIAILVGYMSLVTLMKDIRRTFQYHGAEHKTIFCYEHGKELTVENVRGERRFHPRCGTSFLILMLIVSIFVSFFIDPLFLLITGSVPHVLIRSLVKLLMLPLVMGIGYELIKLAGRHDNLFTRIISAPGMWLQHITVLEPDDGMIECAITAFREVIPKDESDKY